MTHIERAISIVGNMARLAGILGVTPQAVKFWRDGQRRIPPGICPSIERATSGEVTCEQLCPEVDWAYLRAAPNRPPAPTNQTPVVSAANPEQGVAHG